MQFRTSNKESRKHDYVLSTFEDIFKTYYPRLCIYASSIIKSKTQAEDIVQNTFMDLWNKRKDRLKDEMLKGYLYRAVYSQCIDYLRSIQVENKYIEQQNAKSRLMENWIETLFNNEDSRLIYQEIHRAINELPQQAKQIVVMSRIEGKSTKEIANKLNISQRTVENHLYRSIKTLKERLTPMREHYLVLYFILKRFEC